MNVTMALMSTDKPQSNLDYFFIQQFDQELIMEEMEVAINAASSPSVKIWLNWMMIIFLSSIIFALKHKSTWLILAAFFLSLPIALYIFGRTQSVHLIGLAHIALWIPLAIFLYISELKGRPAKLKIPYGIYLVLLLATITISLFLDIRDAILILLGGS